MACSVSWLYLLGSVWVEGVVQVDFPGNPTRLFGEIELVVCSTMSDTSRYLHFTRKLGKINRKIMKNYREGDIF